MKIIVEASSLDELRELLAQLTKQTNEPAVVHHHHIDRLSLTVRERNCLIGVGIRTVEQLQKLTDAELLNIPNFGRHSLAGVRRALDQWQPSDDGLLKDE